MRQALCRLLILASSSCHHHMSPGLGIPGMPLMMADWLSILLAIQVSCEVFHSLPSLTAACAGRQFYIGGNACN